MEDGIDKKFADDNAQIAKILSEFGNKSGRGLGLPIAKQIAERHLTAGVII